MEVDKRVLVTGIGGNVGQGIIRNIKNEYKNIVIIGVNIDDFSAGNHLCDVFYKVPLAIDDNYISTIINIVDKEKIDLIIPSTDYEVNVLAKNKNKINTKIAVSDYQTTSICLDKMETFVFFEKYKVPFATAFLPSDYNNEFNEVILKPREGRGSRGIEINPQNISSFSDDYMVQELHRGVEITIPLYVTKDGKLHGFIVQERTLEAGATKNSKITKAYDVEVEFLIHKIMDQLSIQGALNIQAIVKPTGEVIPFEINCRISGTNSIRAQFGFKDVSYIIEEYLYESPLKKPIIREGIATRIVMDVIYTEAKDFLEVKDNSSNHYIF